jgi:tetratricopeptide (TPR) repeat protein
LTSATTALERINGATHAQVVELLGQILLELERPEMAIDLFRRLFDQRIVTFDPRQLLMCAYRLHRDDDVMAICEELRTRGPVPWDILEFELQQLEKYNIPKAIARIQDFLRDHPENKLALVRLSVIGYSRVCRNWFARS